MYFWKCEIQCEEDTTGQDESLIEGEYWEFKEPKRVEAWSFHMIPHTNLICYSYKFSSAQVFLTLSFDEKVKDMEKSSEVSLVIDSSIVDEMENVLHSTASERKIDYKSVSEAYKRFWATCEDAYVFNVGEKVEIDITKLIPAPPTCNIRSQESRMSRTWSTT